MSNRSPAAGLIQLARLDAGLTQAELARRLGVRPETISSYERGLRDPGFATLLRILRAAGFEPRIQLAPYNAADDPAEPWLTPASALRTPGKSNGGAQPARHDL